MHPINNHVFLHANDICWLDDFMTYRCYYQGAIKQVGFLWFVTRCLWWNKCIINLFFLLLYQFWINDLNSWKIKKYLQFGNCLYVGCFLKPIIETLLKKFSLQHEIASRMFRDSFLFYLWLVSLCFLSSCQFFSSEKFDLVALPILSYWMHVWLIIAHFGPFLVAQPTV